MRTQVASKGYSKKNDAETIKLKYPSYSKLIFAGTTSKGAVSVGYRKLFDQQNKSLNKATTKTFCCHNKENPLHDESFNSFSGIVPNN